MLWEALGQRRRRLADTPAATYQARIAGIEPKIRDVCPDVPTHLAEICDKATAPDPAARYSSAEEFRKDLEEYMDQASRPPGPRELAAVLQEYFEQERAQRRTRVQDLLSGSMVGPSVTPPYGMGSQSPPGATYDVHAVDVQLESKSPPAPSKLAFLKSRPVAVGGVVVVALGITAAFLARSKGNAANAVAAKAADSAVAAEPVAPRLEDSAKKGEPATVQLFIQVRPPHAVLTLDGARIASNPFQAEVRSDKRTHVLQATAPDYLPLEQIITYSSDTHLELALRPGGGKPAARGRDEGRVAETRSARPAPEPAAEPKKSSEAEAEGKRRTGIAPPHGIDEKDPYAQ
jgi:hypothetical protein